MVNSTKNKIWKGMLMVCTVSVFLFVLSTLLFDKQFDTLNKRINDTVYTRNEASDKIVIIGIDDKTTTYLGRFSQWDRSNYTLLLNKLKDFNPKVIVFDIFFKHSNESEVDKAFANEISLFDNIILEFIFNEDSAQFPSSIFTKTAKMAFAMATPDPDGVNRRTLLSKKSDTDDKIYNSLAYQAFLDFSGKSDLVIPKDSEEKMLINYFANPFKYKIVSFVDVIDGNVPKEEFEDKIVLVGLTSFQEIQDFAITPRNNETYMAGVELHANIIQTLLDEKFLKEQSKLSTFLVSILIILSSIFIIFNLKIRYSSIIAVLTLPLLYLIMRTAYFQGYLVNTIQPILSLVISFIFSFAYRYFISDKQGRELKNSFSKYVSADLVEQIVKNPEMVKLGGEKRVVTVFFMDIKDSTSISEKVEITKWVSQLNEYFTMMESVVKSRGGTVDKFEGDAIMGFFGAPFEQKDQVLKAFLCALDMKEILKKLHEKWALEGLPLIEFRIGINTGEAIVGNIGSINRFDYTAMGDTVNTASRMEGSVNKTYKTQIIAANFENYTDLALLKKHIVIREIDSAIMLGKTLPTRLYEIVCKTTELTQNIQNILSVYSQAINEYRQKNFEKAKNLFASIRQVDEPSKVMEERTTLLLENPNRDFVDEQMNFKLDRK